VVGVCLGLVTVIFVRWGRWWFAISLSVVIAIMMVCYVAVPARLIGLKTANSKRDKLTATVVGRGDRGGGLHAALCPGPCRAPHAQLTRAVHPGIIVFALGLTLEAGTTSALKAVKMSAKLLTGRHGGDYDEALPGSGRSGP
jgi:hypothetical protein